MAAKQRTLRPEIQLLNALLAEGSREARRMRLAAGEHVLQMNDGYFFRWATRHQCAVL